MLKRLSILTSFFFLLIAGSTSLLAQCPDLDSLEVSVTGTNSADFDWVIGGTETSWNYELVDITGGGSFNGTPTGTFSSNSTELTTLSAGNDYEIYIQADCGTGVSNWIDATFSTDPSCFPVVDIFVTNVDTTEFSIEWTPVAGQEEWDIELVNITAGGSLTGNPTDANITDSSFTFTNLTPGDDYQLSILADCGIFDGESEWSDTVFVTTDELCITPLGLGLTSLSSSTADIAWSPQDGETEWEIEIIDATALETQSGNPDYITFDSTYAFVSLLSENEYHVFVRAVCGGTDGSSEWTEAFIFTTPCAPYTLPFSEDFDVTPLACWTIETSGMNIFINTGFEHLVANPAINGGNATVSSPLIDNTGASRVFFNWSHKYLPGNNDTLALYGSPNGGGTWTLLWEKNSADLHSYDGATLNSPGIYQNEYVPLPSIFDNNEIALQFRIGSPGGNFGNIWIDSVGVELMPSCNFPYNIEFSNIGSTGLTVDFDIFGSGASTWDYEVVEAGFGATGTPTGSTSSSTFAVTGLSSGTLYKFYMRANCTSGDSDWVGPYSFATECAIVSEFTEGFESTPSGIDEVPMCWNSIHNTGTVLQVETGSIFGTKHIRMRNQNIANAALEMVLVSPEVSNLNAGTHWLSFMADASLNATINVGTMSDPSDYNTFTSFEVVNPTLSYDQYTVDFTTYTGTNDHIAFKMEATSSWQNVHIDQVKWQEVPTCFPPTSFEITDIDTSSVNLDITPAFASDTLFEVSLVDLSSGGVFTGVPTDTVSINNSVLDGLSPGNFYEIYIRTVCSGSDISDWTIFPVTFTTNCVDIADINEGFEVVNPISDFTVCWTPYTTNTLDMNVDVDGIANSGTRALRLRSMWGVNDPSAIASATSPAITTIYSDKVLKFYARSSNGTFPLKVGTTNDPTNPNAFNERMTLSVSNSYQQYTVPFVNYTDPEESIVFYMDGSSPNVLIHIDDVSWEDAPTCADVVGLANEEIMANTASVSWLPVSTDTLWYLEIVSIPGVPLGVATDTATSIEYLFDGLSENSDYQVYVMSSCTGASWVGPIDITTLYENNVALGGLVSPNEDGCGLTTTEVITVELINSGGNFQTNVPIEYSWDFINWIPAGSYTDTLFGGDTVDFVFTGLFDFSTADDSTLYVRTALATDAYSLDNSNIWQISNLGDAMLNLQINFGSNSGVVIVDILDSITGDNVYNLSGMNGFNNTVQNYDVCLFKDATYDFQASSTWGNGAWEDATYELTTCGIINLADNGGVSPDDGTGSTLESTEYFYLEGCADNNLTIVSTGGPYSSCGLSANESFEITIQNNGLLNLDSADADLQINFNGAGFVSLSDFPAGLEPDSSITFTTSSYDLSSSGVYSIDVSIVFADDEFMDDNTASFDVVNAPTLITDTSDFDVTNGFWANDNVASGNASWEWGVPTSTILSNGAMGSVWATGLSTMISSGDEYYLESPCYDFSSYSFPPEILYDYINDGGISIVQLQGSTDGGANYSNIQTFANTNAWTPGLHILASYMGESDVKFRWKFSSGNASGVEGFAFDNWNVVEHIPFTDASLSDLEVNGVTVAGFHSDTLSYTVTLPYGAVSIPNVVGTPNATIVDNIIYDNAVLPLPDTTFVTIIAEDTLFSTTYMVVFEEAPPSSNNDLSMITVDGVNVPGFNSILLNYVHNVPYNGSIPTVGATVSDPTATVSVTQSPTLPGIAIIVVTAQDGTTLTYTVNINELPPSTNANLNSLTVNGVNVPGFNPSILIYYDSSFATPLPIVGGTQQDPNAISVVFTQVGSIPDTAFVVVTAEDGVTTQTYMVVFDLLLNINAQLLGIDVDAVPLAGFNTNTYTYTMELPYNDPVPTVTATLADALASYVVNSPPFIPGTTDVVVTAQNGVVTNTYSIIWTETLPNNDAHSTDISLASGTVGSITPAFGSGTLEYLVCLGDGDPEMPEFIVELADTNASYVVILPDSIPGDLMIEVTAEDGVSVTTYTFLLRNSCDPLTLEEDLFKLTVYPNPSKGSIVIESNLDAQEFKMELINQIGAVVFSKDQSQIQLNETIELDELSNGVYILRLFINGQWYTDRITILK